MNTTKTRTLPGAALALTLAAALLGLALILCPAAQAAAGDISEYEIDGMDYYVEWGDEWGEGLAFFYCEYCTEGYGRNFDGGDHEGCIEDMIAENILECGHCLLCAEEYHCAICGKCFESGDAESCPYCDTMICLDCHDDTYFCDICGNCRLETDTDGEPRLSGGTTVGLPNLGAICIDCEDQAELCAGCGGHIISIGDYLHYEESGEDWCPECRLCPDCVSDFTACADFGHCLNCGKCGSDVDVCDDCGWCEDCAPGQTHCPECNECFGDEIEWCPDGGEHCVRCDEANEWICERCGGCIEVKGTEKCGDCGLCVECCLDVSDEAGCIHGYCVESSDYWDHVCPSCGSCPEDAECEYCEMCEDCQTVFHCDHDICPENTDEWEEHLCESCGDCFELDELCELCHMCESCNEHCRHDICPEDGDYDDHFCEQCGECYEEDEFCDICGLCVNCCEDNTLCLGCDHGICIESDEFQDHYCFVDDQCLEYCDHIDCDHEHVSAGWKKNQSFHWHVCEDCGGPVDSALHVPGNVVVEKPANPMTMTNGTSRVYCGVCGQYMETITTSYLDIKQDGSPYIVSQPKDYEGRISVQGVPRYATMTVIAGGENLRYQWYERLGSGTFHTVADDAYGEVVGSNSNSLTVLVREDACTYAQEYFCLVSNAKGDVESRTVSINARHVYDYVDVGNGTHIMTCIGDIFCGVTKGEAKPHRFSEQQVVRVATTTQTGLLRRKCADCQVIEETILPKLDPNHVHSYTIAHRNSEEHWWQCACGKLSNRYAHDFNAWTVTRAATDLREGQRERTCRNCDEVQTEIIAKLPHTHNFTGLRDTKVRAYMLPNGYVDKTYHYKQCATDGCFGVKKELHSYDSWRIMNSPYTKNGLSYPGTAIRNCRVCGYGQTREFSGQWPILTEVFGDATAEGYGGALIDGPTAANTGDTVTLTVTLAEGYVVTDTSSYHGWSLNEVNSTEGLTINGVWVSYKNKNITNFSVNGTTYKATFTMPAGPVALGFFPVKCNHSGQSTYADVVQPSCTVGGANVRRCSRCHGIASTVSRIEPTGHTLSTTPIPGTQIVEYCSITKPSPSTGYTTGENPVKYGYSGDFMCTVCGEVVSGERTPQVHGREDKDHLVPYDPGQITTGKYYTPKEGEEHGPIWPTCTKAGYTGDSFCAHCGKRVVKGERIEPEGHDWDDWHVIKEATRKQQGKSQRSCNNCDLTQTRTEDYSGPDYELKADRMKLHFDFAYGEEVQPQTITFTSVGRDAVTEITDYEFGRIGDMFDVDVDGLVVTLTPRPYAMIENLQGDYELFSLCDVKEANGDLFLAPDITITANIRKGTQAHTLTVTGGKAYLDGESPLKARTAISARSGDIIHLVADLPEYFWYWSTNDAGADPSGLFDAHIYFTERSEDAHLVTRMPPNNVKVNANYELSGDVGNGVYWEFDPGSRTLTISGSGEMVDYWLPGSGDEPDWAYLKPKIEAIHIEPGVTNLGQYLFYGTPRVKRLEIPDSLTHIGAYALTNCPALSEILVGSGNSAYASLGGVLYNKAMTELITFPAGKGGVFTVPDGVTRIDYRAFLNAAKLTEVTIPASVNTIGADAFLGCASLKKAVILNPQVQVAQDGEGVFAGASPSLVICAYPGSMAQTYASNYGVAFREILEGTCGSDLSWSLIDETLHISGTGAMTNTYAMGGAPWYGARDRIKSVTVEEGVTSIGKSAFYGCSELISVSLPDTLQRIEDQSFYNCGQLPRLTVPANVTYIGNQAFRFAYKLRYVTVLSRSAVFSMKPFTDTTGLTILGYTGSTAQSHASSNSLAFTALDVSGACGENVSYVWDLYNETVTISGSGPMYDYGDGDSPFAYVVDFRRIVIEEGVTHVGEYAFFYCDGIEEVSLPESVTSIGARAFQKCYSLHSVTVMNPDTAFGVDAFKSCSDDLRFTGWYGSTAETYASAHAYGFDILPGNGSCGDSVRWRLRNGVLTVMGSGAMANYDNGSNKSPFNGDTSIRRVEIGSGVTAIGNSAFYGCTGLTDVDLGGVQSLGMYAFQRCSALTEVDFPASLDLVGVCAFQYCSALTRVTIPNDGITLWSSVFASCPRLAVYGHIDSAAETYARNNRLTYIPLDFEPAFFLPAGLTLLEDEALSGIPVVAVVIPNPDTAIQTGAFDGSAVKYIYAPYGSQAQSFAVNNGMFFVPIDAEWLENH